MNWFSKIHELAGQEYERYLPTAFDESLTLLEKVNKVIETLNQIVLGVNTVADYVDGQVNTQNEKIKQLRDDYEVLKYWLENEGLEERTKQVLNEWFDNGRLAQIINNDVFDMKADKATFDQFVLSITAQLQQTEQELSSQLAHVESGYKIKNETMLIAHRGLSFYAPENTISAYEQAIKTGYTAIEIDVHETLDNKFIIMHDATVERTTNGVGAIKDLTYDYIRSLIVDGGNGVANFPNCKVPDLDEVLKFCKENDLTPFIHLNVLNNNSMIAVIDIIKKYGLENKAVIIVAGYYISQYVDNIRAISNIKMILIPQPFTSENYNAAKLYKNIIIGIEAPYTADVINMIKADNLEIAVFTINNYTELKKVKADGVGYVISDKLVGGCI